jgi:NAD-dependent dihydropyrimidine dehydrogenase PreA subunit
MVKVDTSKCNGCGTCAEICPVEGIKLIDGKAVPNAQCVDCGTCIGACPTEAITPDGN